jgi:hypothetical protein
MSTCIFSGIVSNEADDLFKEHRYICNHLIFSCEDRPINMKSMSKQD